MSWQKKKKIELGLGEAVILDLSKKLENTHCMLYKRDIFITKEDSKTNVQHVFGDIVLIKKESVPRMNWRKGRINKLSFGNDGSVGAVELLVINQKRKS